MLTPTAILGILPVLFDGLFHVGAGADLIKRFAPDWVLARGLFDLVGLPPSTHRIIGGMMIAYSVLAFYLLTLPVLSPNQELLLAVFYGIVVPLTVGLIVLAAVYKIFVSSK